MLSFSYFHGLMYIIYDLFIHLLVSLQSLVAFAKLKRQLLLCTPEARSPKDFTDGAIFWINQQFAIM